MKISNSDFQIGSINQKNGINKLEPDNSGSDENSFGKMLAKSIGEVNRLELEADVAAKELAIGKSENIHDVMIAMEKASVSFRMMVQVRNKMIDAYQEVMRMQV